MQQKYRVNGNLKDDQGTYTTGDIVLRTPDFAEPLVAIGRLELVVEERMTAAPASNVVPPAAPDTMTAQQTGATMTAQPDQGVQTPPTQQPAARPTAEAQTPTQTATNQPTPEQIAQDVAGL